MTDSRPRVASGRHDVPLTTAWMRAGTDVMLAAIGALDASGLQASTALPGWTGRMLVAHLARNADGLVRLLQWAQSGVETPMYASPDQRMDEIVSSSRQGDAELVGDCRASAERLDAVLGAFPPDRWTAVVKSALGRTIPAAEIPWIRCREVWLHSVDLSSGTAGSAFPAEFARVLIDDVLSLRRARGELKDVAVEAGGEVWQAPLPERTRVRGELWEAAGWLTNRVAPSAVGAPEIGPWI